MKGNLEWSDNTKTKVVFTENENGRYTMEYLSNNIGESIWCTGNIEIAPLGVLPVAKTKAIRWSVVPLFRKFAKWFLSYFMFLILIVSAVSLITKDMSSVSLF